VKAQHPSIAHVLGGDFGPQLADRDRNTVGLEQTTSPSLARALAIGCLSRLDPSLKAVNVWDPAVGTGFAGHMLVASLRAAGVDVQYRGQDIHAPTVSAAHRRFEGFPEIELAVGNTLEVDAHKNFRADLVMPHGALAGLAQQPQ
jgi:type I restriction enzyme M protein